MLVQRKESGDDEVGQVSLQKGPFALLRRQLRRVPAGRSFRAIQSRPQGCSYFSDDRSVYGAELLAQLPPSDILNLHWVAGFFDWRLTFAGLGDNERLVWTLHDMNTFTGGCHFAMGCERYTESCGACPELGSTRSGDLSSQIWLRKKTALVNAIAGKIRFVTPSRWLAREARRSALLKGANIQTIPYGLDTNLFKPRDREKARLRFQVPNDSAVLLFVADQVVEARKGLSELLEAIRGLASLKDLFVLIVGHGIKAHQLPCRSLNVGFIRDPEEMSGLYNSADIVAVPSLQDNFPNTALEAQCCGVPVVGFRVGGLPEIVEDGVTGMLVPEREIAALRAAIESLLADRQSRERMGEAARRKCEQEFQLGIQAGRYEAIYRQMMEDRVEKK
jgi:glycosyltransferase involved in cell wall biosynthesis